MTDHLQPQVVRSYLRELEAALAGVSGTERRAILEGATEELSGMDAAAAAAHIEKLGDPEFIAAEARAESSEGAAGPVRSAVTAGFSVGDPRWYIVLASLLVAFGGVVIPVLGWVVGMVMVWISKSWRTWEKLLATLTPLVIAALVVLVAFTFFASPVESGNSNNFQPPNPLMPAVYDIGWSALVLLVPLTSIAGLWLLVRALRGNNAPVS